MGKRTENSEDVVGNYAKGKDTSENGQYLIEMCYRNDLILINTVFKHKMDIKPKTHTTKKKPVPKSDRLHHNQEKTH